MRVEAHVHIGRARKGLADCISARKLPGGKVFYTQGLPLQDVKFAVQYAGRRKFLMTGQKNVHAFVRGTSTSSLNYVGNPEHFLAWGWTEVKYNPARDNSFVLAATGEPVYSAGRAVLLGKKVYAQHPKPF